MRRAAKVDASQADIVAMLRRVGASVQSLAKVGDGCPDLLVGHSGETYLMEVKEPGVKRRLRPSQAEWHREWCGAKVHVVQDVDEALRLVKIL